MADQKVSVEESERQGHADCVSWRSEGREQWRRVGSLTRTGKYPSRFLAAPASWGRTRGGPGPPAGTWVSKPRSTRTAEYCSVLTRREPSSPEKARGTLK